MKRYLMPLLLLLPLSARGAESLQLLSGHAWPLSPLGQQSFASEHTPAGEVWGRALWTNDTWEAGYEGLGTIFDRRDGAGSVTWWQADLSLGYVLSLGESLGDRVVFRLGAGVAGVDADAPLVAHAWTAPAFGLGLDYELPLGWSCSLVLSSGLWAVMGPLRFDGLVMAAVGLGLAFNLPSGKDS